MDGAVMRDRIFHFMNRSWRMTPVAIVNAGIETDIFMQGGRNWAAFRRAAGVPETLPHVDAMMLRLDTQAGCREPPAPPWQWDLNSCS